MFLNDPSGSVLEDNPEIKEQTEMEISEAELKIKEATETAIEDLTNFETIADFEENEISLDDLDMETIGENFRYPFPVRRQLYLLKRKVSGKYEGNNGFFI